MDTGEYDGTAEIGRKVTRIESSYTGPRDEEGPRPHFKIQFDIEGDMSAGIKGRAENALDACGVSISTALAQLDEVELAAFLRELEKIIDTHTDTLLPKRTEL